MIDNHLPYPHRVCRPTSVAMCLRKGMKNSGGNEAKAKKSTKHVTASEPMQYGGANHALCQVVNN
jgi:hypothetical protein